MERSGDIFFPLDFGCSALAVRLVAQNLGRVVGVPGVTGA